jgi:hypothetical protein
MLNAVLGYQMKMTVNLTVKMVGAEKSAMRDNGLQLPLIIEWE